MAGRPKPNKPVMFKGDQADLSWPLMALVIILLADHDGTINIPTDAFKLVSGYGVRVRHEKNGSHTFWIVSPQDRIDEMKRLTGKDHD